LKKRQKSLEQHRKPITTFNIPSMWLIFGVVALWQAVSLFGIVDAFVLPPPTSVINALINDMELLFYHGRYTLFNAMLGLFISIVLGCFTAIVMDRFAWFSRAFYPILVLSQTVPYIAIAPLLVLWFGHGSTSQLILITLVCFFPVTVGMYDGLSNIKEEYLWVLSVMGGTYTKGLVFVKIPLAAPSFFSGAKIATTYCFVGAVIAEWLGGTRGLGVYMTRVRRTFEFDKMFAVIFVIVFISIVAIGVLKLIERKVIKDVI